jgi:5'-phosphate synthase pdxT subunit
MVKELSIGIIGIQGSISEHITSIENTLKETKTKGKIIIIKNKDEINYLDALLIPGGESTTISKELNRSGMYKSILDRILKKNLPIMGTCAGCILLASEINQNNKEIKLLNAMKMKVKRNAFGRQKESFEKEIFIDGFSTPFNGIFIRAPVIEEVWGNCKIHAKIENKIVMARENNLLAIAFHPELTDDIRIHKYFIDMI